MQTDTDHEQLNTTVGVVPVRSEELPEDRVMSLPSASSHSRTKYLNRSVATSNKSFFASLGRNVCIGDSVSDFESMYQLGHPEKDEFVE